MAGTDERLIIAIDQSTSATKAIAFTPSGAIAASASSEHAQHYPRPGWVEHDPEELYACTLRSLRSVVGALGAAARRVAALAITNQRETIVVWDRVTGRPACRAPVWLCQRGADLCARLAAAGHGPEARRRTGLPLDPYFSASKIRWILDNVDGARAQAREGRLLFGTVDSWLAWKLTGGRAHVTDPTNASRTLLMNLADLAWDDAMFALFDIPRSMAPTITRSTAVVGTTTAEGIFDREVPIAGLMGDSHAAFFAQRCFSPGEAKATYGTGTSLMMNVGPAPIDPGREVVASVGFATNDRVDYVLEGNIHSTGDTIRWLRDGLGLIADTASSEEIARSVPDSNGVYLVPAFQGLGAPYWDNDARAAIVGMARNTTKAHVVRAALEAIAFQVSDLAAAMVRASGTPLVELRVDGGATRNELLMQMQADIVGVPVARSAVPEASAMGSALMAGLAAGLWSGIGEIARPPAGSTRYEPRMPADRRAALLRGWHAAVGRILSSQTG